MVALGGDAGVDLGVVHKHRAVRDIGAAVMNALEPALLVDGEAVAIAGLLAVGEHERGHHLVDALAGAYAGVGVVLHPGLKVADGAVDRTGPDRSAEVADLAVAVLGGRVALGLVGDHVAGRRTHHGPGHAERAEHVVLHEGVEILARGALDDGGGQAEGRVVVVPLGAGGVLERWLALNDVDQLGAVDPVAAVEAAARHAQQVEEFAESRGVGDEVPHLDGAVEPGQFGDVGADVVVEGEVAAFGLQHDGEGGELLGGGADVGAGVLFERQAVGQVGHAGGVGVERLAVAPDTDRGAG